MICCHLRLWKVSVQFQSPRPHDKNCIYLVFSVIIPFIDLFLGNPGSFKS